MIAAPVLLACVASVSVGFSARSRHFSPFGGAKIGASATLIKKRKMLQTCGKPYGNACYAGCSSPLGEMDTDDEVKSVKQDGALLI